MPSKAAPPRWAPLRIAAAQNGISYRTLLLWVQEGRIKAHRFGPRLLQVDLTELEKLRVPVRPRRRAS